MKNYCWRDIIYFLFGLCLLVKHLIRNEKLVRNESPALTSLISIQLLKSKWTPFYEDVFKSRFDDGPFNKLARRNDCAPQSNSQSPSGFLPAIGWLFNFTTLLEEESQRDSCKHLTDKLYKYEHQNIVY